jgi:predicted DsbA family dithiol-disulfide isomerase
MTLHTNRIAHLQWQPDCGNQLHGTQMTWINAHRAGDNNDWARDAGAGHEGPAMHDRLSRRAIRGADGDSGADSGPSTSAREPPVGTRIDIVSDAICPWCYIGKRHLERALAELAEQGLGFSVHWNPFQLNPDMPKEGVARAAYRLAKFGSPERVRELDTRVTTAATAAALDFHLDLIRRTPNTLDAHRLIWFAGRAGVQDMVVEAVFRAYFVEGDDIGDQAVLTHCAVQAGLGRSAVMSFLASGLAEADMRAADRAARGAGVCGVPSFFLDGYSLFSGAVPPADAAEALRRGRRILEERPAASAGPGRPKQSERGG